MYYWLLVIEQERYLMRRGTKGFTIVELIIIITVIGIRATIGIISWSGAQNRAKKNSYQATAEQVKLKLGEYFTEKNRYYGTKAEVETYLGDIGSGTLKTEFQKTAYEYTALPGGCSTAGTACTTYTITVPKSNWNGGSSESNISVAP